MAWQISSFVRASDRLKGAESNYNNHILSTMSSIVKAELPVLLELTLQEVGFEILNQTYSLGVYFLATKWC